uniref:TSA: Wollemia nobilis Ref_Wollemi_Transcript_9834_3639 transcribed RNA sequence n=1 Tax=Wollemia nobilis TaxID=56998 RepID=A0A0C9S912_9CONI
MPEMKGERKYFCQLGRKIVERAQMKKKGWNRCHRALTLGNWVNLSKNGTKKGTNPQCCSAHQCCSGKAALDNYQNFRKSAVPARVMYFWNGIWNDFSDQVSISLKEAFSAGMPTVGVEIDGSRYLVDFLRMLQIDLRGGYQRSIGWIDEKGKCFFPKTVLEDNIDGEEASPKVEVEVEIRITPTEASNTENCGGVDGNIKAELLEVSKTKRDCLPSNSDVSKNKKCGLLNTEPLVEVGSKQPAVEIVRMDELKTIHLTNNTSIKAPICATEFERGPRAVDLSMVPKPKHDRTEVLVIDPPLKPLTKNIPTSIPTGIENPQTKLLTNPVLNDVPTAGTTKLESGSLDRGLLKVPKPEPLTEPSSTSLRISHLANKTPGAPMGTKVLEKEKGSRVSCDEAGGGAAKAKCHSHSDSQQSSRSVATEFELLDGKLIKLKDSDIEYMHVQKKFLDGLRKVSLRTIITGIYRNSHKSALGQARLEAFQKQIEITENSRGNANIRYAWHGTSLTCVSTVIVHGFSHTRILENGPAYGVGVYLSPGDCSYLSVPFSDLDKKGEQCVVLCRVILGNVEEVPIGSHQFHPSSDKFDSGVDDLINPKYHIIWSTHMNTHILPEYIISFKAPQLCDDGLESNPRVVDIPRSVGSNLQDAEVAVANESSLHEVMEPCINSTKESQQKIHAPIKESGRMPSLPTMSFLKLLSIISKFLPTASINALEGLYTAYKVGRIGKDVFTKKVRMIAGERVLLAVIRSCRAQAKGTEMLSMAKYGQSPVACPERQSPKTEFSTCMDQLD